MQEAFVSIGDVPTHIMTWGKWIEESLTNERQIVICITGNPGLPGFYTKFLSTIHSRIDANIPVWVIGHAGHDEPPEASIRKVPPLEGNEHKFDLDAQIKHKAEFINKYVPANVKIHLIGHSIGAYIILQLLEDADIKRRVKKCYMLFPTVERMKSSPNGKFFTLSLLFMPLCWILLSIFNKLPFVIKSFMVYIYFWIFGIPQYFIGTTLKYFQVSVMKKVVFLAKDEMAIVKNLNVNIIRQNIDLLKFYYGSTDGWVPLNYITELKEKIPNADVIVDKKNILHAFVLRSSEEMGDIVAHWIEQYKY